MLDDHPLADKHNLLSTNKTMSQIESQIVNHEYKVLPVALQIIQQIAMKRRLLSIVYLVARNEKTTHTTATITSVLNKVPCDQDSFFSLTPAQTFVLQEMSNYPATSDYNDELYQTYEKKPEKTDEANKIASMLVNLPCDMSYLQVEQARDWLKELSREEVRKNWRNLKLLQRHLKETLSDGRYEGYVQQSVLLLIQELDRAQRNFAAERL